MEKLSPTAFSLIDTCESYDRLLTIPWQKVYPERALVFGLLKSAVKCARKTGMPHVANMLTKRALRFNHTSVYQFYSDISEFELPMTQEYLYPVYMTYHIKYNVDSISKNQIAEMVDMLLKPKTSNHIPSDLAMFEILSYEAAVPDYCSPPEIKHTQKLFRQAMDYTLEKILFAKHLHSKTENLPQSIEENTLKLCTLAAILDNTGPEKISISQLEKMAPALMDPLFNAATTGHNIASWPAYAHFAARYPEHIDASRMARIVEYTLENANNRPLVKTLTSLIETAMDKQCPSSALRDSINETLKRVQESKKDAHSVNITGGTKGQKITLGD